MNDAKYKLNSERAITYSEWVAEGKKLFGDDQMNWSFICPVCGHVAQASDWKDAGAPEGAVAFSCLGRYYESCRDAFEGSGPGPCNYTGGGLFQLNPVVVTKTSGDKIRCFEFAKNKRDKDEK